MKASAITPVPGGVGPMTIAMLLTLQKGPSELKNNKILLNMQVNKLALYRFVHLCNGNFASFYLPSTV